MPYISVIKYVESKYASERPWYFQYNFKCTISIENCPSFIINYFLKKKISEVHWLEMLTPGSGWVGG